MKRKKEKYDIVLTEAVSAVDRHGMNFMRKGTKGILLTNGKTTSIVKIAGESYELPNVSFSKFAVDLLQKKAA